MTAIIIILFSFLVPTNYSLERLDGNTAIPTTIDDDGRSGGLPVPMNLRTTHWGERWRCLEFISYLLETCLPCTK